jgi:hypothetical protein
MLKLKPQLVKLNLCKGHLKRCRKKKKRCTVVYSPHRFFQLYEHEFIFFYNKNLTKQLIKIFNCF